MKETKTLAHIHFQVERYARKLLKKSGYTILPDKPDIPDPESASWRRKVLPGQKGLTVTLTVVGYCRRYDGWEYELTPADWKAVFSIAWDKDTRRLLKKLQQDGNKNLLLESKFEEGRYKRRYGGGYFSGWINKQFVRNRLPYHLGLTHKEPLRTNGYPDMLRLFKRPVPIDGELEVEECEAE